ncbi:unnamed protein product [Lactuca saligna]|uniref:Uncharacterized protein n=1 Tax=Lactuca saligna TaxID=75948 RepID=A0AA36A6F8_LACSI|nr:unnamed protein product [Lactuca saligna]
MIMKVPSVTQTFALKGMSHSKMKTLQQLHILRFLENVFIPSPTTTISTPITIVTCPSVTLGISQTPPIFNDSTTTPTTSVEAPISVNASDARTGASDDFARFSNSSFNTKTESNDEAPVTRGQLKAIHTKLDSLLHASKASSTDDYSQETIKSLLETLTKEHSAKLE